jgi:hypothetical protein
VSLTLPKATTLLRIDYESEGFGVAAPVVNGSRALTTNWDELLKAALTVGRPSWQYVFRNGPSSFFEAIFRLSLVRMALEQRSPTARRLHRTPAARSMDPTERGAINYFIGMTVAKLFAARLLTAEWMLHFDVFRPATTRMLAGRSRPDFVGQMANGNWVIMEAKGRASEPASDAKSKAKGQARRIISINGSRPALQIGAIAFLRREALTFYWNDPEPEPSAEGIAVEITASDWRYYFGPTLGLVASQPDALQRMQSEPVLAHVEDADIRVGIRPDILRLVVHEEWSALLERRLASDGAEDQTIDGHTYGVDGIAVVAGESWRQPFNEEAFLQR